ncbi:Hypothetical protein SRAE_1000042100 [Strongyloides ratti]|uniref:Uncharacterized protein n=1 Tax=Strongyloides ratti TaxID=34506 RepID=A0A090L215_STRRB|nr:Hypothetical protein SRAE_1000042100 [Strongyloides ratti]CEF62147.1 Hypothetical protein SRAE_1000042100 [Strongyloides ratti]
MDELIIIIIIVVLCVSVFAGWLATIAFCPDQAMACLGNSNKKNQNLQKKDETNSDMRKMIDKKENRHNELNGMKENSIIDEDSNDKERNNSNENDQTRLIKKEELLKYTQKHSNKNSSSLENVDGCDSQMIKPHLIMKHESTDVIEYAIVDYNSFVAVANQQDNTSPITSNNSGDIIMEDDDDLLVSCALEDSRDNITENINYPYKFQEHHLSLLTYDPTKRRESLPIPINHHRLSPTRDVIKAV